MDNIKASYDAVAKLYGDKFQDEMDGKPRDRQLLDRLAQQVGTTGPICDLGCGPGQVARYLKRQGADVLGVDLSPGMIEEARRCNPQIPFFEGNMLELPFPDASWGGIAAFYCIIHIPREQVGIAFREMWRVLRPRGVLLASFHVGQDTLHLEEWWGHPINLDFHFLEPADMETAARDARFELEETVVRDPDPAVEYESRRAYLFARKPG